MRTEEKEERQIRGYVINSRRFARLNYPWPPPRLQLHGHAPMYFHSSSRLSSRHCSLFPTRCCSFRRRQSAILIEKTSPATGKTEQFNDRAPVTSFSNSSPPFLFSLASSPFSFLLRRILCHLESSSYFQQKGKGFSIYWRKEVEWNEICYLYGSLKFYQLVLYFIVISSCLKFIQEGEMI